MLWSWRSPLSWGSSFPSCHSATLHFWLGIPTIERCLWENNALRNGFWYVVDVSNTVEIQPLGYHDRNTSQGDVMSAFVGNFVQSPTIWAKHDKFFLRFPRLLQFPLQSPKHHTIAPCLSYNLPSSTHHRRPYPCPPVSVRAAKQPLIGTSHRREIWVWEIFSGKSWEIWYFLWTKLEDQKLSMDLYYWSWDISHWNANLKLGYLALKCQFEVGMSRLMDVVICPDVSNVNNWMILETTNEGEYPSL